MMILFGDMMILFGVHDDPLWWHDDPLWWHDVSLFAGLAKAADTDDDVTIEDDIGKSRDGSKTDDEVVKRYVHRQRPQIILGMGSANERRHYNVTSSLIGWAHTQNDLWKTV